MLVRHRLLLLGNAKTYRISLASQGIDSHTQHLKLLAADPERGVEACKERPLGIDAASSIQQQIWTRVASENNAVI